MRLGDFKEDPRDNPFGTHPYEETDPHGLGPKKKQAGCNTSSFAGEQGRAVFALPGSIYAPQSKGTNRLIREGAQIYLDIPDLLEVLNLGQVSQQRAARAVLPADATEAKLYAILGREPVHVDEIGARADLPIAQVAAALALMELKGMVRQVGGMNYVAVFEEKADYQT